MKIKEIRERESDAIQHELKDLQRKLFDLRTQATTEKLEDPSQLAKCRKDIARLKTVLRERKAPAKQAKAASQPAAPVPAASPSPAQ